MSIDKRVLRYSRENYGGVMHTTLNPEGPGVVRIHLVPPQYDEKEVGTSVAIINGQDIIPVSTSWTILLSEFIKEVNRYSGKPVSEDDIKTIMKNTQKGVRKVFPLLSGKLIREDIHKIMKTFYQVALGEIPNEKIGYLSLGEYASYMRAPHRMDLMISAMTKQGRWNCNQRCVHCYAAGQIGAEEDELTTEQWKAVIDKCREVGIPQVTFTGGEPTVREDLPELVEHAAWFVTRLNTNGTEMTPQLCERLRAASLDSVQITFYSRDSEIHNRLVGTERYYDTVAGIENALAAGLNLSINTPLCTLNKDYRKTLEFLKEKGVTYVTCSGLITTGSAALKESESLQLSSEEIREVLKEAVEYCYSNDMEISFTSPGWVEESFCKNLGINVPKCGACLSNMAITPGGNVVPCQSWLSEESLGNILTDEWRDIWESEGCIRIRENSAKMEGKCPLRRFARVEYSEKDYFKGGC